MIQDIAPHFYDNSFNSRRAPLPADLVLPVRKEELFLRCAAGKDDSGETSALFEALTVENLLQGLSGELLPEESPDEQTEKRGDSGSREEEGTYRLEGVPFIFLFRIDETAYYGIDEEGVLRFLEECAHFPDCGWQPQSALRTAKPGVLAFAGITAIQLARWRSSQKFCGRCGERMLHSRTERAYECPNCKAVVYPRINPAVIVAVTHGDRILLTKYAGRAYTRYALIAGFAEVGETIEETVHREVLEEVGLRVKNLRFYKSQPWSFSDSLLMGFYCDLQGENETVTLEEDELAVGEWFRREEMPERRNDISLTAEMMEQFRLGKEPR